MKSNILISFIIPHKNIPALLYRSIASIPQRDDIEIIVVDDNSDTDNVDFIKHSFPQDERLKIIFDKSGKRQGHARNIGLDIARGEWVFFLDADDFLFYSINQAIEYCKYSSSDIIYYKSTNLDSETFLPGQSRSSITNSSIDLFLSKDKWGDHMLRYRHPVPWGKFIRRSLIEEHRIRFPEIEKAEDFEFSYLCGHYAKQIEGRDISVYCITTRSGNLTSTVSPSFKMVVINNQIDFLKFMWNKDLKDTPSYKIVESDVFAIMHYLKSKRDDYNGCYNRLLEIGMTRKYINYRLRKFGCILCYIRIKRTLNSLLHYNFR